MQEILSVAEFRANYAAMLNRAAKGERILVGRRGKPMAALVPLAGLEAMQEAEEDRLDGLAADRARKVFETSVEKAISLEEAVRDLCVAKPRRKKANRVAEKGSKQP